MKTSGTRAKGSRQAAASLTAPGTRAVPAYASANPLDFQEPWQDEVGASSQPRASIATDQQHRQTVAPVLSEGDLPEDWEEAATIDEVSDQGSQIPESALEHAEQPEGEGASPAVDDGFLAESSPDPTSRHTESIARDATIDVPATAGPAHANSEETVAAAASFASDPDAHIAAEASSAGGSQGLVTAADRADGSAGEAFQDSGSSAGEADSARPHAGGLEGSMPWSAGSLEDNTAGT